MIFNLASASLIYQEYNQNKNETNEIFITYPEYCLSITDLFFMVMGLVVFLNIPHERNRNVQYTISFALLTIEAFNIAFSSYVIDYHNENRELTKNILNMALAIIILNCLSLCGFFGSHYKIE